MYMATAYFPKKYCYKNNRLEEGQMLHSAGADILY